MDQFLSDLKEAVFKDLKPSETAQENPVQGPKSGSEESEKPLVLKTNVCYIVSAVIIEDGKVLMIKEAKKSCRGKWYLPAGRMKKNESLVEGVQREVHEESGLHFEPTSLVCVDDSRVLSWQRFNFTGHVTGGKLKTIEEQDSESIEAGWFDPEQVYSRSIPLRAIDVIPLIKATLRWKEMKERDPLFISLPVAVPHKRITIQVVLVSYDDGGGLHILVDKENCMGFLHCTPSTLCCSVKETVQFVLKQALKSHKANYKLHGIITVEHVGKPHGVADGVGYTFLAEIPTPVNASKPKRYSWTEVADERLKSRIRQVIGKGCVEAV